MTNVVINYIIAEQVTQKTCKAQRYGILAQLGEHLPYKQRVIGSSPIGPISYENKTYGGIAQLARAYGSYPYGRWFESISRHHLYSTLLDFKKRFFYFTCLTYNFKI